MLDPPAGVDGIAVSTNMVRLKGEPPWRPAGRRSAWRRPMRPSDAASMDNCPRHCVTCRNSPDLNPIEMPYSKFKTFLRKVAARTIPSLNRADPLLFIP